MKETYSTRQAAGQLGVARGTLQKWIAGGYVPAPRLKKFGSASARVWTGKDIARVKKLLVRKEKRAPASTTKTIAFVTLKRYGNPLYPPYRND